MDLQTILKAVQLVGEATPAAKAIFEGFAPLLHGADQATLKDAYRAARLRSDDVHRAVQDLGRE